MNYTQNEKIEQVTDSTMVVGVDIGSQIHYARAFDNRGRELTKRIFSFHNDLEGFNSFNLWAETLKTENKKTAVLIGCEPTGHYWFAFAKYVNDHQKRLVMVNPFSVKKIKELDDNSPKKTDSKDPKTIAKLVVDLFLFLMNPLLHSSFVFSHILYSLISPKPFYPPLWYISVNHFMKYFWIIWQRFSLQRLFLS